MHFAFLIIIQDNISWWFWISKSLLHTGLITHNILLDSFSHDSMLSLHTTICNFNTEQLFKIYFFNIAHLASNELFRFSWLLMYVVWSWGRDDHSTVVDLCSYFTVFVFLHTFLITIVDTIECPWMLDHSVWYRGLVVTRKHVSMLFDI